MSMVEAAICPLCGQGWCGRPCLRDPKKQNALLFKPDGTEKTLHERGLAWDDPPLQPQAPPLRSKPRPVLLKQLATMVGTKTGTKTTGGTKTTAAGTKTRHAGGRPKTGTAMTAAERKRRWLERQKPKE
jgi:hypothetical protein